jgi:hypothetical protein
MKRIFERPGEPPGDRLESADRGLMVVRSVFQSGTDRWFFRLDESEIDAAKAANSLTPRPLLSWYMINVMPCSEMC